MCFCMCFRFSVRFCYVDQLCFYVNKVIRIKLGEKYQPHVPHISQLFYQKSNILRKWEGLRPQDIKSFQPEQWRTFKDAAILKTMRGKRGGGKTRRNNIPVILSRFRKKISFLLGITTKEKLSLSSELIKYSNC